MLLDDEILAILTRNPVKIPVHFVSISMHDEGCEFFFSSDNVSE